MATRDVAEQVRGHRGRRTVHRVRGVAGEVQHSVDVQGVSRNVQGGTHVLDPFVHGYLLLLSAATNSRVLRNQPQKPVWRLILHQSTMLDAEVPRTIVGRRAQHCSTSLPSIASTGSARRHNANFGHEVESDGV